MLSAEVTVTHFPMIMSLKYLHGVETIQELSAEPLLRRSFAGSCAVF